MNIGEAFEILPKSESTLLRRMGRNQLPFEAKNDTVYGPCFYRILVNDSEIGAVKYYGGRRLSCYEAVIPESGSAA